MLSDVFSCDLSTGIKVTLDLVSHIPGKSSSFSTSFPTFSLDGLTYRFIFSQNNVIIDLELTIMPTLKLKLCSKHVL